MSRKSLILCLAVIAVMMVGIGIAVSVLYSGTETRSGTDKVKVSDDSRYLLLPAVPSDALMLCCFSDVESGLDAVLARSKFPSALLSAIRESEVEVGRMTVSLHFAGKPQPLYVFDAGKASDEPSQAAELIRKVAQECGCCVEYQNCSTTGIESPVKNRSIVVVSPSEGLVRSSLRHIQKSVSIMDAPCFAEASVNASSDNAIFILNESSAKMLSAVFAGKYASWANFPAGYSRWMAFDAEEFGDQITFSGKAVTDGDLSDFVSVFEASGTSSSMLSSVLPSYTLSALTIPVRNTAEYISNYQNYLDARQTLQTRRAEIESLEKQTGVSPVSFFAGQQASEVASASFVVDGKVEKVNLVRLSKPDMSLIFSDEEVGSLKDYTPAVHRYRYSDFAAKVFGSLFKLPDESCFTLRDGWLISGCEKIVAEFASGQTGKYSLKEFLVNTGLGDLFSGSQSSFMAYLSFTEDRSALNDWFRSPAADMLGRFAEVSDCSGVFISMGQQKLPHAMSFMLFRREIKKSKPVGERNVTVAVPKGPFKVRNSGTGKMNLFYQQDNLYLCLKEDGGKGLWGVPFTDPICGTAQTVDYYANGKLQILFGAGSKLYLIDRLGRFVTGFPVDLKKDILVGPDVYDFNGVRRYNVMVLHKDNTIEMYNLKGQKPDSWKGIRPSEIIRALPERIIVGGNTFWVVRTSVQTLIYPFAGGEPLTVFKGEQMALPESEVRIIDGNSVELQCYDGKSRSVRLK